MAQADSPLPPGAQDSTANLPKVDVLIPTIDEQRSTAQTTRAQRSFKPYASWSIIASCISVYVIWNIAQGQDSLIQLAFSPGHQLVWPGLISHMFAHATPMHLLGNMLGVFFLGSAIEQVYGRGRYLALYLLSGIIAALAQAWFQPDSLLIGASGALAGIMAAFWRHFPHVRLYLYGVIPVPTWVLIPVWLLLNAAGAGFGQALGIAFVAHLAGFAGGLLLSLLMLPPRGSPLKR